MRKFLPIFSAVVGLASSAQALPTFVEITGNISSDTKWTRNNVYILREITYVLPPAKLTIEAGTIIRGVQETSPFTTAAPQSPGGIIVARGAQIEAIGTADDPIVFTSINDPNVIGGAATVPVTVNGSNVAAEATLKGYTNYLADGATADNGFRHDALWGGLVVLGEGPIGIDGDDDGVILNYDPVTNTYTGPDTVHYPTAASPLQATHDIKGGNGSGLAIIEGVAFSTSVVLAAPYTEQFPTGVGAGQLDNAPVPNNFFPAVYGGTDKADNSGVLRFVESRYGGFLVGTGNELNGITFGATGTGCSFDWLSAFNNADDGFEFFGGYSNWKFLFSLFTGDDGLDGDQGFNGTIQHAFVIQDNQTQNRAAAWTGTATGRILANQGDNGAEWDGSEHNTQGSILPNTEPWVYNFTICSGLAGGDDGARSRRGTLGRWFNGLFQDAADDAWRPVEGGAVITVNYNVYATVADNATQLGAVQFTDDAATALARELVSIPRSTWPLGFGPGSLDPRLVSGAASAVLTNFLKPADRTGIYPFTNWVDAPFAGAMRDNNMVWGWTVASRLKDAGGLSLAPATNIARPAVTLGLSGSNPTISFASATGQGGRAVVYLVEGSTDGGKSFLPIAVVSDNNGAGTVDAAAATFATLDGDGAAGTIRVTDTTFTVTSGSTVLYRACAL